ncbi:unnamed protein product [[Candida] boidinii]|nr:unnamed protein product [[Candida] boidinii]
MCRSEPEPGRTTTVAHISPKPQIATQMTRKHQLQIEVLSEHKSNSGPRTLEVNQRLLTVFMAINWCMSLSNAPSGA